MQENRWDSYTSIAAIEVSQTERSAIMQVGNKVSPGGFPDLSPDPAGSLHGILAPPYLINMALDPYSEWSPFIKTT